MHKVVKLMKIILFSPSQSVSLTLKKDIEKILTEDEIISNHSTCNRPYADHFSLNNVGLKNK